MQQQNISTVILTGDSTNNTKQISSKLNITKYYTQLLPIYKYKHVVDMQKHSLKVAMVGDGVNDSIALSAARIGIAICKGSDIAIENASVVLM